MSSFKFGILGGDLRYKILCGMLKKEGYQVCSFYGGCGERGKDFNELFIGTDVIIGPIPFSKDDEKIFLTGNAEVKINDLLTEMDKNEVRLIIGGVISDKIRESAAKYGIRVFDFFEHEAVAVLNAIPTAEGAILKAINESDRTIFGSKCIVMGYGRCGKFLAQDLKGLGADVSATFRNERDEAYIKAFGYKGINLYELKNYIGEFDFIFNTIPAPVIDKGILKKAKRDCIIIDIAQAPGGVDFCFAKELNIKAFYCPGLPGRVAPVTAAEILKDAVLKISISQIHYI